MADFWISDTHFSHKNIVRGVTTWGPESDTRDFVNVEEHDNFILDQINSKVGEGDVLWHLGDWSFGGRQNVRKFRELIRCRTIYLVFGNHDKAMREKDMWRNLLPEYRDLFAWWGDYTQIYINKTLINMCHYAGQVWEDNHHAAIMLHGHSHDNLDHANDGKILDVCVEGHNGSPWSFDEIMEYMDSRPIVAKDHHNSSVKGR